MAKIFIAIGIMVGLALLLSLVIALVSTKFKVKEDQRATHVLPLMPNANCGGCGYPGCSGLVDALISGEVTKVKTCKVISPAKAQEVVDYLNTTPGPDGKTLKVTL